MASHVQFVCIHVNRHPHKNTHTRNGITNTQIDTILIIVHTRHGIVHAHALCTLKHNMTSQTHNHGCIC